MPLVRSPGWPGNVRPSSLSPEGGELSSLMCTHVCVDQSEAFYNTCPPKRPSSARPRSCKGKKRKREKGGKRGEEEQ